MKASPLTLPPNKTLRRWQPKTMKKAALVNQALWIMLTLLTSRRRRRLSSKKTPTSPIHLTISVLVAAVTSQSSLIGLVKNNLRQRRRMTPTLFHNLKKRTTTSATPTWWSSTLRSSSKWSKELRRHPLKLNPPRKLSQVKAPTVMMKKILNHTLKAKLVSPPACSRPLTSLTSRTRITKPYLTSQFSTISLSLLPSSKVCSKPTPRKKTNSSRQMKPNMHTWTPQRPKALLTRSGLCSRTFKTLKILSKTWKTLKHKPSKETKTWSSKWRKKM